MGEGWVPITPPLNCFVRFDIRYSDRTEVRRCRLLAVLPTAELVLLAAPASDHATWRLVVARMDTVEIDSVDPAIGR